MKSGRYLGVLVLLLAFSAMVLLGSACGGGTAAVSGGSPLGDDAKTYTDSTYGYSIKYPASWRISNDTSVDATAGASAGSKVAVFDPDGASANGIYVDIAMVSLFPLSVTITDADIPALESQIQTMLDGLQSQGNNVKVATPLAQTELNGLKGYKVSYTLDKESVPCRTDLYFLFKGDKEYSLTVQAATKNWDKNQAIFAAILASFATQ